MKNQFKLNYRKDKKKKREVRAGQILTEEGPWNEIFSSSCNGFGSYNEFNYNEFGSYNELRERVSISKS